MNNTKKNQHKQPLSSTVFAHYFFIEPKKLYSKKAIIDDILKQVKQNQNFSLGEYVNEEKLKTDLERKIFGPTSSDSALCSLTKKRETIQYIVENILQKSFNSLYINDDITIYIIPFCNEEASKDLDGVNAFPVEGNILYLLIDINNANWEKSLKETVPHEYAHLVYTSNYEWNSILDGLVNEGLAEHFREYIVGGNIAPWSKALGKGKALKELKNIPEKEILNLFIDDSNVNFYVSYFFGTMDLPKWYGYSIGYWLIDEILKTTQISIVNLFNKSPKEIFNLWKK